MPVRKKSGNLFNDSRVYIYIYIYIYILLMNLLNVALMWYQCDSNSNGIVALYANH